MSNKEQEFKKLLADVKSGLETKRDNTNIEQELFLLIDILTSLLGRLEEYYIKNPDIVDNLLSEETKKVLSARQGKILFDIIKSYTDSTFFNGGTVDGEGACTLSEAFKNKHGIESLTMTSGNAGDYNGAYFICTAEGSSGIPLELGTKLNDWVVATESSWGKISDNVVASINNSDIDNLN